ncbi:MAG TPA: TlpA disulfide reductase family protein [Povalibacter sp.]|nr:TlpA disulfide reductase family protein [Povalibacter sp.]
MKSLGYVAVAVLAAAAGFAIYRYGIAPQPREQQIAAAPTPEPATPAQSPLPTELPEFSLPDRDGQMRSIRSWPGKSMIVNFWATWCAPCRREIPLLRQIQKENDGIQVVGIALDFDQDALRYAAEIGIDYPILLGEKDGYDAVNRFGLESPALPFTVFTDNQARIVLTHLGEVTRPQSKVMLDAVARVNRGELTPAAARTVVARQLQQLDTPGT